MNEQIVHEAIQWFVLNESGRTEDEQIAERWDEWREEPTNRSKYVQILRLVEDMRALPPPKPASRDELQEDAAREITNPGPSSARRGTPVRLKVSS